ncbi:MAG: protein-glutamine glutaminase family protein [Ignavibacteria bacterium]
MIKSITIIILLCTSAFAQYERIEYSIHSDSVKQNSVTPDKIDSIYTFIYSHSWLIDFEDCNICKSRAHIISRMIEKNFPEITISKVWLIADSKRNSQKEAYRYKPVVYLSYPGKCQNWSYHVSPIIITDKDTFVIDPATQTKAVKLNKWAGDVIPKNSKGFLIIKDDRFYIYPETGSDYFADELPAWDENDRSLTDNKYLRSVDETLQAKHGFCEPWKFNYYVLKLMELLE